jgi:hypothetical protein
MSYHEENARKQNLTYLDQSRRNALTPLNLGIFDDTSLRLLEGEFRNEYKPTGAPVYRENQVYDSTPYGVGGGTRSAYFKVTLLREAWIILTKGGEFPNYLQVSCYTFDGQPVEQRFIHDADSITIEGIEGRYYPFMDTVAGAPSNLYNDFDPFKFDGGNTTYSPLAPGEYLICISTIRTEPFKYSVGLVIEFPAEEVFIICEDAPNDDRENTYVVQEDAIDDDGLNIGEDTTIIRGSDGQNQGLITVNTDLDDGNYWSFSGIGIDAGTTVEIGLTNTWMIAPLDFADDSNKIECNYEEAYLETIHDRDLNVWKEAWIRDFQDTQQFPIIFEYLVNLPALPNLEELASRGQYLSYRTRNRLANRANLVTGADVYGSIY